jgi:hypothetical protein
MRTLPTLLLGLWLAGCAGSDGAIRGWLAEDAAATDLWVVGGPTRTLVENDSFRIEGVAAGPVDLRFARGDEELGRMEIRDLPAAGLELQGVWIEDGVAFPTAVALPGGGRVAVNGIHFGVAGALPAEVEARVTVLAADPDGDAFLARPLEADLPDLRVVVTPATEVVSVDGDPVGLRRLSFGDTLEVAGATEADYLLASRIVVPRRLARSSSSSSAAPPPSGRAAAAPAPSPAAPRASEAGPAPARGAEAAPGRGRGQGKGRGRGQAKGRG